MESEEQHNEQQVNIDNIKKNKCEYHNELKKSIDALTGRFEELKDQRNKNGIKIDQQNLTDENLKNNVKEIYNSLSQLSISVHKIFATKEEVNIQYRHLDNKIDNKFDALNKKIDVSNNNLQKGFQSSMNKLIWTLVTIMCAVMVFYFQFLL